MMLLGILLALVLVLVTVALVVSLFRNRYKTKLEWGIAALSTVAFVGYALLVGRWDLFSYYLRPVVALALPVAFIISLRRVWRAPWWTNPGSRSGWSSLGVNVLVCALFIALLLFAARGLSAGEQKHVDLSFPLEDGTSYVGQGGATTILNRHNEDPSQAFAIDVVELNQVGSRAYGLAPRGLDRYAVFGTDVVSPCAGKVVGARDGLPDLIPPETDPRNLAGNHAVVRCEGVDVLLAHLQEGSVAVETGDTVGEGDPIGKVGNSGNTSEPHLHVHAVRTGSGSFLEGEGVPVRFDGRFLVRNSLVFGG